MKYSIRMRAAQGGPHERGGDHISGAERIVSESNLPTMAEQLVQRALHHSKGKADFINITIDGLADNAIHYIKAPNIITHEVTTKEDGWCTAQALLGQFGIAPQAVERAFVELCSLTQSMRGAMLIDATTGERLDNLGHRGVRVTHMDMDDEDGTIATLRARNLSNVHVREAVVLSAKVLSAPGIVGELCWSDDPDYQVGYVSGDNEYHRITKMKDLGSPIGGRVFFVKSVADMHAIIEYLQHTPVLVRFE